MDNPGRKTLPHDVPSWIDPSRELYFLTVCARDRAKQPLIPHASALLDSLAIVESQRKWGLALALIMPDHVHLLASFAIDTALARTVRGWKRWTATHLDLAWQRDFFEHRLRTEESAAEKARYIRDNPVRAGLVSDWREWPHLRIGDALRRITR